jgi:hypothetical protein
MPGINMLKKTLEEQNLKVADSYVVKPEKNGGCFGNLPEKTESYPNFWIDSHVIPEVKDWEIDGDYTVVLKVTMKSKSMNTRGDKKKEVYEGSFDIKEAGVVEMTADEKKEEKTDEAKKDIKKMYA